MSDPVLTVRDLRVTYATPRGPVHAVRGVSLAIPAARIFGLVGESGSGKSTVAQAVMGALGPPARVEGEVRYRGDDLLALPPRELRRLWGRRLAMVSQDPASSLNPVLSVGAQLVEVLREHERLRAREARRRMHELFAAVQLPHPAELARRYPHQLSGGQQQRVSIAIALACDPDVLVLDEPTTGLDVTTEARILDLVESLRERSHAAILYISHNLAVIRRLCDLVAVMYAGEVVERGSAARVFARPRHPYTVALLDCLPRVDAPPSGRLLPAIEGAQPDPAGAVRACQFAPRCRLAVERCHREVPGWFEADGGHGSRCFYADRVPPPAAREREESPAAPDRPRRGRPLLEVDGLVHHYRASAGVGGGARVVRALDGVSLGVAVGETLAVVGESGAGKTTLGRSVVGLLRPSDGQIRLEGTPLPRRLRPGAGPSAGGSRSCSRTPTSRSTRAGRSSTRWRAPSRSSASPIGEAGAPTPRAGWPRSGWASATSTSSPRRSAAASASGSPSRARSRAGRTSSSVTSRPRRSTSRCRRRS